jgi:prolyl-tRNA synthetase
MFRLQDRGKRDMCLGMTHEEIITWLASLEIRSYRDIPQVWYQIQTKFRDEARPKSGVLRSREFLMKDSYSFDRDETGLKENYQRHAEAYHRIFSRCGGYHCTL